MKNKPMITIYVLGLAAAVFLLLSCYSLRTKLSEIMITGKLSPIVRLVTPSGYTFCTAVVVSPTEAYTANHCINSEVEIMPGVIGVKTLPNMEIRATDNKPIGVQGAPFWWDFRRDIAIIHGDFRKFQPRKFINTPEELNKLMDKKTKVISCGYPYLGPLYCSSGNYIDKMGFHWSITNLLLPGMSGGPTMLEDGTVVAINDAVDSNYSIVSPTYNMSYQGSY